MLIIKDQQFIRFSAVILILITALFFDSCKSKKDGEATSEFENKKEVTNIIAQLDSLEGETKQRWDQMMKSDKNKFFLINRLIEELSYLKGKIPYDEEALKNLSKELEYADNLRFTRDNFMENQNAAKYDSASLIVIDNLNALIASTVGFDDQQFLNELAEEISLAEDSVLIYRKEYDKPAIEYNKLLNKNKELLEEAGIDSNKLKERGYFTIYVN